jgi:prepilin-type N-terminal cleavage/methylation domain-containing protein
MKKKTVKGFTLIELIVVMAIFGIIMFGALQLIPPVSKMMVQADVNEGGNAAVSSISNYLEGQLSSVEYLSIKNSVVSDSERTALVKDFVDTYYKGVLKAGSTVSSPVYGTGTVHVLQIDNTANGKISSWDYTVSFDPSVSPTLSNYTEWAVNKAYYDSYSYEIKPGSYSSLDVFDSAVPVPDDVLMNFTARETSFTIKSSTNRNNTTYSFLTNSTMSLSNIYNRPLSADSSLGGGPGGAVTGIYYVVDKVTVNIAGVDTQVDSIVDISSKHFESGRTPIGSAIKTDTGGDNSGYCFVYSYGVEMITQ